MRPLEGESLIRCEPKISTSFLASIHGIWSRALEWLSTTPVATIYLFIGLLIVPPLCFLTPPFQTPDEHQHFFRAYQLAEGSVIGVVKDGEAGAVLPSSLLELADRFIMSREIHRQREYRKYPFRDTLAALAIPLEPERREFGDFSGAAVYSPLPYLPQIAAIAAGKAFGLGPLGLLYAARLANGVAGLLLVAAALRALPCGRLTLMVLGLFPMVLSQFASTSPDAAIIATAFLFTALATRAFFRGRWNVSEVVAACVAGVVFCSIKPVYAPLLVLALPAALKRDARAHVLAVHAIIVSVALGATASWLKVSSSIMVLPRQGTNLAEQMNGVLTHPLHFVQAILETLPYFSSYLHGFIGHVGWGWELMVLPNFMYVLALLLILASLSTSDEARPRRAEVIWCVFLFMSSAFLVFLALYLYWTPVGADDVEGIQGRYFLPLAGLLAVALSAVKAPGDLPVPAIRAAVVVFTLVEGASLLIISNVAFGVV